MTRLISPALQVAGLAVAAIGIGLIYLPAGIVVGGLALFATGFVLDLPARRR